jgi:hypothetical protein
VCVHRKSVIVTKGRATHAKRPGSHSGGIKTIMLPTRPVLVLRTLLLSRLAECVLVARLIDERLIFSSGKIGCSTLNTVMPK